MQAFVKKLCKNSIFVGHGVNHDLKVFGMNNVRYIDTGSFEDRGKPEEIEFKRSNPRKLKDLVAQYLNATIQEGTHSSVIDARSSMGLFKMRQNYLE